MHERDHEQEHKHEGHLPPADLPQHKTYMGFRPHIFIGGLVLIAILFLYLLLLVRPGIYSPAPAPQQPKATPTSSFTPPPSFTPA
jgi:hypothetical protein